MAKLYIKDFACFAETELELGGLTILVGKQASGKSLIARLIYFFSEIPNLSLRAAEQSLNSLEFRRKIGSLFVDYFPPTAWGRSNFLIIFEYENSKLSIRRRKLAKSGSLADSVRVSFSENFNETYLELKSRFENAPRFQDEDIYYSLYVEERLKLGVRRSVQRFVRRLSFKEITFIPAGRSFFTSIGKALSAFETGGLLDPITLEFGRKFMALRGQRFYQMQRLFRGIRVQT